MDYRRSALSDRTRYSARMGGVFHFGSEIDGSDHEKEVKIKIQIVFPVSFLTILISVSSVSGFEDLIFSRLMSKAMIMKY
jgi:hypothetical protein